MKTLYNTFLLLLVLSGQLLFAHDIEQEKFKKSYPVKNNSELHVKNSFGAIEVITSSKKEIEVLVEVIISMKNESKAQERYEKIKIKESQKGDIIYLETDLGMKNFNMGKDEKFEVNYTIHLPNTVTLNLENSFGNISIPDYKGKVSIDLEYGNLDAGNLESTDKLNFSFGKATIEGIGNAEMKVSYMKSFQIGRAGELKIEDEFSKLSMNYVESIDLKSSYSKYELDEIGSLSGKTDFSGFSIGKLNHSCDLKVSYASGKFTIMDIDPAFKSIILDAEFSTIEIELPDNISAKYHSYHSFGSLSMNTKNVTFRKEIEKDFSKEYEGWIGKNENATAVIDIKTSYGSLKIR